MLESFHAIFRSLEQLAKPAIAIVDGAALGGGCELVAGCDIVIASERARFGQPEIKLGVFPPVACVLLPLIIGDKRARELILTGELIGAGQARGSGLSITSCRPSSCSKRRMSCWRSCVNFRAPHSKQRGARLILAAAVRWTPPWPKLKTFTCMN